MCKYLFPTSVLQRITICTSVSRNPCVNTRIHDKHTLHWTYTRFRTSYSFFATDDRGGGGNRNIDSRVHLCLSSNIIMRYYTIHWRDTVHMGGGQMMMMMAMTSRGREDRVNSIAPRTGCTTYIIIYAHVIIIIYHYTPACQPVVLFHTRPMCFDVIREYSTVYLPTSVHIIYRDYYNTRTWPFSLNVRVCHFNTI